MSRQECDKVVIVGGGISGLGCAYALAVRGVGSLLVERRKDHGEIDRGDVLHPATLRVLTRWGLSRHLRDMGAVSFSQFAIIDHAGRSMFRFDAQKVLGDGVVFTSLRHPRIEEMMESAARASGLVEILKGVACTGLITEKSRVTGISIAGGQVRAPLVVLATGAQSRLVDAMLGRGRRFEYGVSFLNSRFRASGRRESAAFYVMGRKGLSVIVPLPENEVRIGLQYHHNREALSVEDVPRRLAEVVPRYLLDGLELLDTQVYRLAAQSHRQTWQPGALAIGDAAHRVHPVGGQGMNLGLVDSELLAEAVSSRGRLLPGSDLDAACERFARMRWRQLAPIRHQTHLLGLVGSLRLPWMVETRSLCVKGLSLMPFLTRSIMRRFVEGGWPQLTTGG